MRRIVTTLVAALTLLAAGCGADNGDESTASPAPTTEQGVSGVQGPTPAEPISVEPGGEFAPASK